MSKCVSILFCRDMKSRYASEQRHFDNGLEVSEKVNCVIKGYIHVHIHMYIYLPYRLGNNLTSPFVSKHLCSSSCLVVSIPSIPPHCLCVDALPCFDACSQRSTLAYICDWFGWWLARQTLYGRRRLDH